MLKRASILKAALFEAAILYSEMASDTSNQGFNTMYLFAGDL